MIVPNVLCLSGHDPSGGAGIQADLESVAAHGAHAACVITALTRQDTRNAYAVTPLAADEFAAQLDTLSADMRFAAVKIGLLGSAEQAAIIARFLRAHPELPIVLDPVLTAGGGASLARDPVAAALQTHLFPLATIITPNAAEARRLCAQTLRLEDCGARLVRRTPWVLITGGDENGNHDDDQVTNTLYARNGTAQAYHWPRLPHHYHGSGCTLASAIAARLARGDDVPTAVASAQDYTWRCLRDAFQPGQGQHIPDRVARHL